MSVASLNLLMSVLACLCFLSSYSQSIDSTIVKERVSAVSISLNANATKGDLSKSYGTWQPGIVLGYVFNDLRRFSGSLNLGYGSVVQFNSMLSPSLYNVETYVRSTFFDFYYLARLKLFNKERFKVSIGQGIGLFVFNPKDEFGNSLQNKQSTREDDEVYSLSTLVFPTTIELSWLFFEKVKLTYSLSWLRPSTDYIDNMGNLGNVDGNDKIIQQQLSVFLPIERKK